MFLCRPVPPNRLLKPLSDSLTHSKLDAVTRDSGTDRISHTARNLENDCTYVTSTQCEMYACTATCYSVIRLKAYEFLLLFHHCYRSNFIP